jgi:hypothetical protein
VEQGTGTVNCAVRDGMGGQESSEGKGEKIERRETRKEQSSRIRGDGLDFLCLTRDPGAKGKKQKAKCKRQKAKGKRQKARARAWALALALLLE